MEGAEFYQAQLVVVTHAGSTTTLQEPSQQVTASFPLTGIDASSILHIMILVQAITPTQQDVGTTLLRWGFD